MSNTNIYYVYAYLRSKDSITAKAGTPYYIGKGKDLRAFSPHPGVTLPKDKSLIVLLETNLSNIGSLAIERRLIRWFGRKDLNTGILLNKTDGGEGSAGIKFSESHRAKISEANRRRGPRSEETRKKMSVAKLGKALTDEQKCKSAAARKGLKVADATKEKIGLANKGENNGMYGKVHTVAARAKMSAMRTGVKRGPYQKRISS
jgi:hypothetical protein